MALDHRELDNRLTDADAQRHCLSCGSSDVDHAAGRFALIEVGDDDRLDLDAFSGEVVLVVCRARICKSCGFVHLYSQVAVDR